jgi:outer membrane protein assembly factor BamB
MTEHRMPFEQLVAGWMADAGAGEAAGAPVQLLDQILATTGRTRPQPRWLALLAEKPMASRRTRVAVGLPNRGLVYAVLVALLLAGLAALAVGAALLLNQPGPTETAADWSGFRGNADHSGVGLQGPAGNPVVQWQFHASGAVLEVAVVGSHAFFAADDGSVYSVARDRGFQEWSVRVADPPLGGPFAADGRLYLSDQRGAFHAISQKDGSPIWTTSTEYDVPSRAVAAEGSLYFGTSDGLVIALDAATGVERWRLQPPESTRVDAPAFGGGLLFAGTDGAGFVAIDPVRGQVVWQGDTQGEDTGTAAVADGVAYVGVGTDATNGKLRAFDAKTGRLLWASDDDLVQLPSVGDGVAYAATTKGLVVAIDVATGATKWRLNLNGETRAPVIANGVLYLFAGLERRLYAVDAATGSRLWQLDLDATGNCCIAVAHGSVYAGLQDGSVYAIGGDGSTLTSQPFPSIAPSPTPAAPPTEGPTPTPLPSVATVTWTTDLRGKDFAPISQIAVDPQGRIWAPEANADRIAIFSPAGKLLEEWGESGTGEGQFDFSRGNGDGYGTLAFAKDGSFFVLDVGNRRVQHFDVNRRFVRAWGTFGTRPGEFTDPVGIAVALDGTVWVLDDIRSVVEHYRPDGTVIGSFDPFATDPVNKGANSLAIDPHGNLYVSGAQPSKIYVFDASGRFVKFIGDGVFAEQATHIAIDADGRIFVTQGAERRSAPGILVFAPDGTLLGGFGPLGEGEGQLVFPAGIALDGEGGLYVEDSLPESARLVRLQLLPPAAP